MKNPLSYLKRALQKDSQFLFNTLVLSLVAMAILHAFAPYINTPLPIADIKPQEAKIISVQPQHMKQLVSSDEGKPVMLVIYASWCGYCKKLMPGLVDMVRTQKLDHIKTVFLSIDSETWPMAKYLAAKGYGDAFIPYRFDGNTDYSGFGTFIEYSGSHYQGAIPYVGFFTSKGKLVTDISGMARPEDILSVANQLKN